MVVCICYRQALRVDFVILPVDRQSPTLHVLIELIGCPSTCTWSGCLSRARAWQRSVPDLHQYLGVGHDLQVYFPLRSRRRDLRCRGIRFLEPHGKAEALSIQVLCACASCLHMQTMHWRARCCRERLVIVKACPSPPQRCAQLQPENFAFVSSSSVANLNYCSHAMFSLLGRSARVDYFAARAHTTSSKSVLETMLHALWLLFDHVDTGLIP